MTTDSNAKKDAVAYAVKSATTVCLKLEFDSHTDALSELYGLRDRGVDCHVSDHSSVIITYQNLHKAGVL